MKYFSILCVCCAVFLLGACSVGKSHDYAGNFVTEDSVRFELRSDSSAFIAFDKDVTYDDSHWAVVKEGDTLEYAIIEFAGKPDYFYLHDLKLYRSRNDMVQKRMGMDIQYDK